MHFSNIKHKLKVNKNIAYVVIFSLTMNVRLYQAAIKIIIEILSQMMKQDVNPVICELICLTTYYFFVCKCVSILLTFSGRRNQDGNQHIHSKSKHNGNIHVGKNQFQQINIEQFVQSSYLNCSCNMGFSHAFKHLFNADMSNILLLSSNNTNRTINHSLLK